MLRQVRRVPPPNAGIRRARRLLEQSLRKVLREGRPDTIALIRYAVTDAAGEVHDNYWSAVHTPLFDDDADHLITPEERLRVAMARQ